MTEAGKNHGAQPALIVLAAGASLRLGQCKALAAIGGRPALAHLVEAGGALGGGPALVVTGAHDDLVRAALERGELRARAGAPLDIELCWNPDWAAGRTGGLGLARALRAGRDLCVAPVDCPLVGPAVFEALRAAWLAADAPARGWLAPRLEPAPGDGSSPYGHPVILGRELAAEIGQLAPDLPLSGLRERADPLLAVEVGDPAVLDDLDRPDDLKKLQSRDGNPASRLRG